MWIRTPWGLADRARAQTDPKDGRVTVETRTEVIRDIVQRTDLDAFVERMLDSFWDLPDFQQLRPRRDEVRGFVRWNVELMIRWLVEDRGPSEDELQAFRELARARAAEGMSADVVPANFRRAAQFAWAALLDGAREEQRLALLDSAGMLFEYVDRVSRIFSEVYATAPLDVAEHSARALIDRVAHNEQLHAEDYAFAEGIGFDLERAATPFVIAVPGAPAQAHADLASQLRAVGALARSEGRRVAGLSQVRAPWRRFSSSEDAVIATGRAAIRHERGRALDELRLVVDAALARGRRGAQRAEDVLPELLLLSSPRLARRMHARVYGSLDPELTRTLDLLIENDFERGQTAAALPVHRNTLRDRLDRIKDLTGVDLSTADGRSLAWMAWLARRIGL